LAEKLAQAGDSVFGYRALSSFSGNNAGDLRAGFAAYKTRAAGALRNAALDAAIDEARFAAAGSFIKSIDISYSGGAYLPSRAGVDALMSLWEDERALVFAQFGGSLDDTSPAMNAGVGVRRMVAGGRALVGVGGFYDWLDEDEGSFRRYVINAEARTPHFDVSANLYQRAGSERDGEDSAGEAIKAYSADGWDMEAAGFWRRYEFAARYYRWQSLYADDIRGWRYRAGAQVLDSAAVNVEYDRPEDGGGEWEIGLRFSHVFGGGDLAGMFARRRKAQTDKQAWLRRYEKARREYSQRILRERVDVRSASFTAAGVNAEEGDTIVMTVALSEAAAQAFSVTLAAPGDLTFTDSGCVSGGAAQCVIAFALGAAAATVMAEITDDDEIEDGERITLSFTGNAGGYNFTRARFVAAIAASDLESAMLLAAAIDGDETEINRLLALPAAQRPDVNARDANGFTALMLAARGGHLNAVNALLAAGAAVNMESESGFTALDMANGDLMSGANRHDDVRAALGANARCKNNCVIGDTNVDGETATADTQLRAAAQAGMELTVSVLIENGNADVNGKSPTTDDGGGDTALILAAGEGHSAVVSVLLTVANISVNLQNVDGFSALMRAAGGDHSEVVTRLLAVSGISVNLQNDDGATALDFANIFAAQDGSDDATDVQTMLADAGARCNIVCFAGDTDADGGEVSEFSNLRDVAADGELAAVTGLLAGGADVNEQDGGGYTALMLAANGGHGDVVDELLAASGISVNLQNAGGFTALDFANDGDFAEIRESLLTAGARCANRCRAADIRVDGSAVANAEFYEAARGGDLVVVLGMLARSGIDINARDDAGNTALMMAALNNRIATVERLLTVAGISVNVQNRDGDTALMMAASGGYDGVADVLLTVAALSVNVQNNEGNTALMFAADGGFVSFAESLLAASDIGVNLQNNGGNTALDFANQNGYQAMRAALIPAGGQCNNTCLTGDVNISGATTGTADEIEAALRSAAANGDADAVAALLEVSGDFNGRDASGNTALDIANENDHSEVRAVLIEAGARCNNTCRAGDTQFDGTTTGSEADIIDALVAAAHSGNLGEVRALISVTEPDERDVQGVRCFTPLMWAAQFGHLAVVEALLAADANPVAESCPQSAGPLSLAASAGHVDIVKRLLTIDSVTMSVYLNRVNPRNNRTALDSVNRRNREDLRFLLNSAGARCSHIPSCRPGDNRVGSDDPAAESEIPAAFLAAAQQGDADAVGAMQAAGNVPFANRQSVLTWAGEAGHTAVVRRMLEVGELGPGETDIFGSGIGLPARTQAMAAAARAGRADVVRVYLAAEIAQSARENALREARAANKIGVVRVLVDARVNVNAKDGDGNAPLIWAAADGQPDIAAVLLAADGVDPNTQTGSDYTALMIAAGNGDAEIARMLINAPGINLNIIQAITGNTALDEANIDASDPALQAAREAVAALLRAAAARCNMQCQSGDIQLDGTITP
jgi:ankyrin repeat protein